MSRSSISPNTIRNALAPFGVLRPQPISDWQGDAVLHPTLAAFYADVGPYGEDGPGGPAGLTIPTSGNPFWIPPLRRLLEYQAGYHRDARSRQRIASWHDGWLVVADQGGNPFILDRSSGAILHARHGGGLWTPEPMFPDIFVMALTLSVIGTVHEEAGPDLYGADDEVQPIWRATVRTRLTAFLGEAASDGVANRLHW